MSSQTSSLSSKVSKISKLRFTFKVDNQMKTIYDRISDFEIIDFHTHPFVDDNSNICVYKESFKMKSSDMKPYLNSCGISHIAGSVLHKDADSFGSTFERLIASNRDALRLSEELCGFYSPGFHIHPDHVDESIEEIRFMAGRGVRLIGELVPYMEGWEGYSHKGLLPILREAARESMTVSFHTMCLETIEDMIAAHPNVRFVAAHPGENSQVCFHVDLMKKYPNYYLDISGTGVFRYHAMKYVIEQVGCDRLLFGTDYPVCNPGVYVGGIFAEDFSDCELEHILSLNAKNLLNLK